MTCKIFIYVLRLRRIDLQRARGFSISVKLEQREELSGIKCHGDGNGAKRCGHVLTSDPLNGAGGSLGRAETATGPRHRLTPEQASLGFDSTRWQTVEIFLQIWSSVACFICQITARLNKVSAEGGNGLFLSFMVLISVYGEECSNGRSNGRSNGHSRIYALLLDRCLSLLSIADRHWVRCHDDTQLQSFARGRLWLD